MSVLQTAAGLEQGCVSLSLACFGERRARARQNTNPPCAAEPQPLWASLCFLPGRWNGAQPEFPVDTRQGHRASSPCCLLGLCSAWGRQRLLVPHRFILPLHGTSIGVKQILWLVRFKSRILHENWKQTVTSKTDTHYIFASASPMDTFHFVLLFVPGTSPVPEPWALEDATNVLWVTLGQRAGKSQSWAPGRFY